MEYTVTKISQFLCLELVVVFSLYIFFLGLGHHWHCVVAYAALGSRYA